MKPISIAIWLVFTVACGWWLNYSYHKALDDSYIEFRDRDYSLFTEVDLPAKYQADFIFYQEAQGSMWSMNNKTGRLKLVYININRYSPP